MWLIPKTNWTKDDYFNIEDFNRIKNNLIHLRELAIKLYKEFTIEVVGADKTYSDFLYADEINKLENNIEVINAKTVNGSYGTKKTFVTNGPTMTFEDLNRWERAMLDIYNKLINEYNGRRSFQWNFGARGGL